MRIIHKLPKLHVRNSVNSGNSGKKRTEIPSLTNRGSGRIYSDVVVGGVLWMLEHGSTCNEAAAVIGAAWRSVWAWKAGTQRPHCVPREPDAIFWNEVRALTSG